MAHCDVIRSIVSAHTSLKTCFDNEMDITVCLGKKWAKKAPLVQKMALSLGSTFVQLMPSTYHLNIELRKCKSIIF